MSTLGSSGSGNGNCGGLGSTEGSHSYSEGTSSGNNASHPDNLEKELNWDEILKSPFNFVEGSKDDNAMDSLVWDESFMGAGGESGLNIDFLMGGGGHTRLK